DVRQVVARIEAGDAFAEDMAVCAASQYPDTRPGYFDPQGIDGGLARDGINRVADDGAALDLDLVRGSLADGVPERLELWRCIRRLVELARLAILRVLGVLADARVPDALEDAGFIWLERFRQVQGKVRGVRRENRR